MDLYSFGRAISESIGGAPMYMMHLLHIRNPPIIGSVQDCIGMIMHFRDSCNNVHPVLNWTGSVGCISCKFWNKLSCPSLDTSYRHHITIPANQGTMCNYPYSNEENAVSSSRCYKLKSARLIPCTFIFHALTFCKTSRYLLFYFGIS